MTCVGKSQVVREWKIDPAYSRREQRSERGDLFGHKNHKKMFFHFNECFQLL